MWPSVSSTEWTGNGGDFCEQTLHSAFCILVGIRLAHWVPHSFHNFLSRFGFFFCWSLEHVCRSLPEQVPMRITWHGYGKLHMSSKSFTNHFPLQTLRFPLWLLSAEVFTWILAVVVAVNWCYCFKLALPQYSESLLPWSIYTAFVTLLMPVVKMGFWLVVSGFCSFSTPKMA